MGKQTETKVVHPDKGGTKGQPIIQPVPKKPAQPQTEKPTK
jgi:hypothetical protein